LTKRSGALGFHMKPEELGTLGDDEFVAYQTE
jgi:hypothetical protein